MDETPASPTAEETNVQQVPQDSDLRRVPLIPVEIPSTSVGNQPDRKLGESGARDQRSQFRYLDGNAGRRFGGVQRNRHDKAVRTTIDGIRAVIANSDVSMVYRNRFVKSSYSASELENMIMIPYRNIPASRAATLQAFGVLLHEYTHQHFLRVENQQAAVDAAVLSAQEKAIRKISQELIDHCNASDVKAAAIQLLQWGILVASEMSIFNASRPAVGLPTGPPSALHSVLTKTPAISCLLTILNAAVDRLAALNVIDECVTIVREAMRLQKQHGLWICLALIESRSDQFVDAILDSALGKFTQYTSSMRTAVEKQLSGTVVSSLHSEWEHEAEYYILPLAELARHSNIHLWSAINKRMRAALCEERSGTARQQLPLVLRLCLKSPELMRLVVNIVAPIVTPNAMWRLAEAFHGIDDSILHPVQWNGGWRAVLQCVVSALDSHSAAAILPHVLRVAFDDQFEKLLAAQAPGNRQCCETLRLSAAAMCEMLADATVMAAHASTDSPFTAPLLAAISNPTTLRLIVQTSVRQADWSRICIRLLSSWAIGSVGPEAGAEAAIRLALVCEQETQLAVLTAFLKTTVPFIPTLMPTVYSMWPSIVAKLDTERQGLMTLQQLSQRFAESK